MRVALWLRVSTDTQEVENQRQALIHEAQRRGWEIVRVYEAVASARRGHHRRALEDMLADARAGRWDVLMTWALDRLTREGPLATLQVLERLTRLGVRVVSFREPWAEVEGPMRDLLLAIAGWVARWEADRIRERTLAGLARARAQGKRLGRPPVVQLVDMALVARLRAEGLSWAAIARRHPPVVPTPRGGRKRPSERTIRRVYQAWARQNGYNVLQPTGQSLEEALGAKAQMGDYAKGR